MRVISGIYKRRRFDVPHTFKARPTTDFAKENLFNVLSNNYFDFEDGVTALDLFAGTGSISIELVSRGCDRVISVEKDPQHLSFISQVMREVKTDKCFPIRADVFRFIDKCSEQFDFIFADPPYALKELESIPTRIFESGIWVTDCFFDRLVCGRPYSYHFLPLFPRSRNLWKGSDTDCHFRSCRRMAGYYARATDSYQQLPKVFLYTNTLPVAYRTYSDGIENGSFGRRGCSHYDTGTCRYMDNTFRFVILFG